MKEIDHNGTKHVMLRCSCSGLGHALQLMYFPPRKLKNGADDQMMTLSTVLPYPKPWYRRILNAVKYVFTNGDCGYLGYEHVFTVAGAKETIEILQEFVNCHPHYNGEGCSECDSKRDEK